MNLVNKCKLIVESKKFNNFIIGVILINAIILGMQTSKDLTASIGPLMDFVCNICLAIFTLEIVLKLIAYKFRFFSSGWNIFDFLLVAISFVPAGGSMSAFRVLRVLRVLRTLKLISSLGELRMIVQALIKSMSGVFWASLLLVIIFYIFALTGQNLFCEAFPEWFGTLGDTIYTLFQIMTLESWSMGISRPVMEVYPWAWVYFVPFVVISSYFVLNVVVGIMVNAVGDVRDNDKDEKPQEDKDLQSIEEEIKILKETILKLEEKINNKKNA
ncbi:MAG: ion transporter [Bacteroidales bacterium]|nr:ion transporter [Bacteroidales bacterium]